jgi:hypothetical protein
MKNISTLSVGLAIVLAGPASAQLEVLPQTYWASTVNNDGLVAGYLAVSPTYMTWNPDLETTEDIGGVSPGGGGGGQAKFAADGQTLCGGAMGLTGSEMATYASGTWTPLGSLGASSDGNASSAWGISADGGTVVGLAWVNGGTAHGVAWNSTEGVMDLGSLFPGASTRANAVSGDGSIVVGWQDFNGPWKSAVWQKDPNGGYLPNTYILIDPNGSNSDENNQAGECSAITPDGSMIGGYGDFANNYEPWTWTASAGFNSLGSMANMGSGYVSAISDDGSIVVGWFDGMFFGDPRKAFIWTATDGLQDLNTYATNELGVVLGNKQLYTASDISPDGRYITGTGAEGFSRFAYRLDLGVGTGIHATPATDAISAWPNPAHDRVQFTTETPSELSLLTSDGRLVHQARVQGNTDLSLAGLAPGVYTLVLRSQGVVRTQRIVKQ